MIAPFIKDRLPSVDSYASSISRSSLSSDPSPRAFHNHVSPLRPSEDNAQADRVAVAGTNDGSLDWREAHENWTSSTGLTLSPSEFGERIIALGGGKRVKGATSATKQPVARDLSPAPVAAMKQPNALPQAKEKSGPGVDLTRQNSVKSNGGSPFPRPPSNHATPISAQTNTGRSAPLSRQPSNGQPRGPGRPSPLMYSTSFNPELTFHSPPTQSPSYMPRSVGFPATELYSVSQHQPQYPLMPSMFEYRQDMDALRNQFTHLQNTINVLSRKVDDATRGRMAADGHEAIELSRDEAMDALAENVADVSTKAAKVDSVAIQVETLKRKVKRLEEANANVQATPSKDRTASVLATNGAPSTQPPDYPQSGFTPTNGLKRGPSDDLDGVRKTPRIDSSAFPPESPHRLNHSQPDFHPRASSLSRETSTESQRPMMAIRGGHYGSIARKRGRPSKKDAVALDADCAESPQWENNTMIESPGDEDGYYQTPDHGGTRGGGLQGGVIRRGTGGDLIRTRRKPVRNADGLLLRADGTIDRRSFTSKVNLQKMLTARSSQGKGDKSSRGSPAQSQVKGMIAPTRSTIPPADGNSNKVKDHDKVMKQMFPHGVAADNRDLNQVEQLFSNGSPVRPKMMPRDEMLRQDAAADISGMAQDRDKVTDRSYVSSTEHQASESPKAPSNHSIMSELDSSPYSPPPLSAVQKNEDTESDFVPSIELSANAPGIAGAGESTMNGFVIPDSYSTGASKVSSVNASGAVAVKEGKSGIPESQDSYKPSMDTHMEG